MKQNTGLNHSESSPYLTLIGDPAVDASFFARAKLFAETATVLTQDRPIKEFGQREEAVCLNRMVRNYSALSRITGIRCDLFEHVIDSLRDYPAYSWTAEMRIKVCSLFLDTAFRWREVDSTARFRKWLTCRDMVIMPVAFRLYSEPLDQLNEGGTDGSSRTLAVDLTLQNVRARLTDPVHISEEERGAAIKARLEADSRVTSLLSWHLNALREQALEISSRPLRRLILQYALSLKRPEHRREMVDSALHDSLPRIQSFLL